MTGDGHEDGFNNLTLYIPSSRSLFYRKDVCPPSSNIRFKRYRKTDIIYL